MLYKGFPKIQTVSPISMAWDHKNLRSGLILFRMRVASSLPVDLCIFNHIFRDCTYPFFDKLMPYFGRPTANHISFKRQPITVPPQMPSFRHSGAMSILLSLILIQSMIPQLQQYLVCMLSHQKHNFLELVYNPHRGLRLLWNFKDLCASEQYFRHIFVICSEGTEQTRKLLELLYKKMKNGDLFCCIFAHESYIYKVGKWMEKSQISNFKPERYFKQMSRKTIDHLTRGKMVDAAGKEALEFNQPVVINFLGVQKADIEYYKNEIRRHRTSLTPTYQYIANLFGNFGQSQVSVHWGINTFQTNDVNLSEVASYYHQLINKAVVHSATIQITGLHGELTLFDNYWTNPDFNRVAARYYGPSSHSLIEYINFYYIDQKVITDHEFDVKLKIRLFGNKILESQKRVVINFRLNSDHCPTLGVKANDFGYRHKKGILLVDNPYEFAVMVKYNIRKDLAHPSF